MFESSMTVEGVVGCMQRKENIPRRVRIPFNASGDDDNDSFVPFPDDEGPAPAANENNVLMRLLGGTFKPTASFCSSEKFNTLAINSKISRDFLR